MDLNKAEAIAKLAIQLHLANTGYKFKWSKSTNALGTCNYNKKLILLSKHWTCALKQSEVIDTILHEIAHALASFKGHRGHGLIWQEIAYNLGAKPEPCATLSITKHEAIPPKYQMILITTNEVVKNYYRIPSDKTFAAISRTWLKGKKNETYGKLVIRKCPDLSELSLMEL